MDITNENSLRTSASAYLRSAMHQPVQWHEWGPQAFDKAAREDKPILLDIGAVWCHWCHVMDRESYEDPDTAAVINEKYIAVKVDRDERPDVDTRYQSAVSTISGQGGWPLTAFLTPDGKPYFGGTYFPPDERYGRPSFRRVLLTMADAFHNKRDEVNESADGVLSAIGHNEMFSGHSGHLGEPLLDKLIAAMVQQFDPRNGGFGAQPKFPHSGAIDLLIDAASRPGSIANEAATVATLTLRKMAAGGIYDHLAGGFHRYSVDERWIVPHFEKMAYDNSELLRNYIHAFQTFLEPEFALVARDIIRWMNEWLSDQERGGFYASQDADASLDDDGDYFTWTRMEARAALSPEEFEVAAAYFNLGDVGDMHHNPQKNVLHVRVSVTELAERSSQTPSAVEALLISAKAKMYAARKTRPTPFVDKTVYTGWNGMCISAYLEAGRTLGMPEVSAFALRSLDRLLDIAWSPERGMAHVVAYAGTAGQAKRVAGSLDDYAFVATAALDAWETSGEIRYFEAAQAITSSLLDDFYDAVGGGFFDTQRAGDTVALGVLGVKRKPLQDSPTPAGNATAATLLLRLSALTSEQRYEDRARETLASFAGIVEHFGLYAASYGLALRRQIAAPTQVCVIGNDERADLLLAAATTRYAVGKSVVSLQRNQFGALPPALAETLPHLSGTNGSFAFVCKGATCLLPITDADELSRVLNNDL